MLDQRYVLPGKALSVTDPPAGNDMGPDAVIAATGRGSIVTVTETAVALQPSASVTVAV